MLQLAQNKSRNAALIRKDLETARDAMEQGELEFAETLLRYCLAAACSAFFSSAFLAELESLLARVLSMRGKELEALELLRRGRRRFDNAIASR
ncbi:MAG: hypothetical protein K2X27_28145 [Candidatus Obscuribacterales bacterium]|nr:hypothetical protein [Candidatus Obscuribacterales bacterium]